MISSAATRFTASITCCAKGTVMSEAEVMGGGQGARPGPAAPSMMLASKTNQASSMPSPRIHCDMRLGPGAQFSLAPEAAQHVSRALRLKVGDSITVFDGRGGEYDAVLQRIDRGRVDVKVGAFRDVEREAAVTVGLVQGLPEADKMDWIVQRAVELGVAWIQPVVCDRSVVRLAADRAARREAHWKRVAVAACEQTGRNQVPA